MTDREKLIQLIVEKQDCGLTHNIKGQDYVTYNSELADHLISNGVTFAKDTDVPSIIRKEAYRDQA